MSANTPGRAGIASRYLDRLGAFVKQFPAILYAQGAMLILQSCNRHSRIHVGSELRMGALIGFHSGTIHLVQH